MARGFITWGYARDRRRSMALHQAAEVHGVTIDEVIFLPSVEDGPRGFTLEAARIEGGSILAASMTHDWVLSRVTSEDVWKRSYIDGADVNAEALRWTTEGLLLNERVLLKDQENT